MTENTSPPPSNNTLLNTNIDPPAVILPPVYGSEKSQNGTLHCCIPRSQNYNVDGRDMKSVAINGNSVNMGNPVVTTENSSVVTGNPVTTMGNSAVTTGSSTVENKNVIGTEVNEQSQINEDPFINRIAKISKEAAFYMLRQKIFEETIMEIDWNDLKTGLIKADISLGDISKIKSVFEEIQNGRSGPRRAYSGRRRRRSAEMDSNDSDDNKRRKTRTTNVSLRGHVIPDDSGDETEIDDDNDDIASDQILDNRQKHKIPPGTETCRAVQRNHKICGRINCRYHRKL